MSRGSLLLLAVCIVHIESVRDPAAEQLWQYFEKESKESTLTTSGGNPVADKTNILTAGERGPLLVQDLIFFDEIQHFDRERIPERVVHAKGAGAFGHFIVTNDIRPYTKATMFNPVGKKTPLLARFSTVIGERASADTARDPRGFAIKFYTEDGIWDMVGNNTPIFFVRDPLTFIAFIHSQKKNPVTNLKDFDSFWDFMTLRPETMHQALRHFSDLGTPDGYRHMNGYGSNTYKLVNEEGHPVYCKFHFLTDQGIRNLTGEVAQRLEGDDPDYATRDLYNNIASGHYPSWTMYIQVMTFDEAERFRWNPFDVTKVWPEDEHPLIEVGKMVLNRNPTNYFADIEQAGFSPSNMIPGIEPSPDKMLQGRLFAYQDTHLHRIGVNYKQLPVNNPFRSTVVNTLRDGAMTYTDNQGGSPNYFPSSFSKRAGSAAAEWSMFSIVGDVARYNSSDEDNYSQPTMFWRNELSEHDRQALVKNMAAHIVNASPIFQERMVKNAFNVDARFGQLLHSAIQRLSSRH